MLLLRSIIFNVFFFSHTAFFAILQTVLFFTTLTQTIFIARLWAQGSLFLLRIIVGLTWRVEGVENIPNYPCIIASKHQSLWETIVFYLVLKRPVFVLKKELTRIPFYGWTLFKLRSIAIDRSAGASSLKKLFASSKKAIESNRQIIIFPEGTRSTPGVRQSYKSGIAMLYSQLDVPIVPVALDSGIFWPKRSFIKKPGCITLKFLKPIPPAFEKKEFTKRLEDVIESESLALFEASKSLRS